MNYRVLVQFDPERSVYVARAPELEHCTADGATRAEAVSRIEEEIKAQLDVIREQGGALPASLDDETTPASDLVVKLSRTLQRDLAWQARVEGIDLAQLVTEMLAGGLDARRLRPRRSNPQQQGEQQAQQQQREPRGERRGGQQGGGGRYHAIMEDRATFLEYVRGLESGQPPMRRGGGQGGGGGGGGQPRGPRRGPRPQGAPGAAPAAQGQAKGPAGPGGQGQGGQGGDDDDQE